MGKLSDAITFDPQALEYLEDLVKHLKSEVTRHAKNQCLKRDQILVTRDIMQDACVALVKIGDQDNPYTSPRGD